MQDFVSQATLKPARAFLISNFILAAKYTVLLYCGSCFDEKIERKKKLRKVITVV